MRILGIDPGSRITGFGIVETDNADVGFIQAGTIRTNTKEPHAQRLKSIYDGLCQLIEQHRPDVFAIERVFVARNPASALILGQARGTAMLAGANYELDVVEYSAKEIKQAVVGKGGAGKEQVQHMVRVLLGLTSVPPEDAADALACAICHAHCDRVNSRITQSLDADSASRTGQANTMSQRHT